MTEPTPRGRQFGCLLLLICMTATGALIGYLIEKATS